MNMLSKKTGKEVEPASYWHEKYQEERAKNSALLHRARKQLMRRIWVFVANQPELDPPLQATISTKLSYLESDDHGEPDDA